MIDEIFTEKRKKRSEDLSLGVKYRCCPNPK
jgi:hypothetical protein